MSFSPKSPVEMEYHFHFTNGKTEVPKCPRPLISPVCPFLPRQAALLPPGCLPAVPLRYRHGGPPSPWISDVYSFFCGSCQESQYCKRKQNHKAENLEIALYSKIWDSDFILTVIFLLCPWIHLILLQFTQK